MAQTNWQALPVDRTIWYSDLAYMSEDMKKKAIWMAQMIFFSKRNSQLVVDPIKAEKYRGLDVMDIDQQQLRNLFDPPTPNSKGGAADYVAADFKAYPIDIHLDNIIRASLEKIPQNIEVKLNDPIAKSLEQKDKEKIIYQREFRRIVNTLNKELGLPPLKDSQDPYKYAENLKLSKVKGGNKMDTIGDPADMIRARVKNDDQFRLYMKYVYKNGIEIALEQAIKYYVIDVNKWRLKSQVFINDIKNFNAFTGMWEVDATTGRPMVIPLAPDRVWTSPFKDKNGDDILYWGTERTVTFAEFERLFGATLTPALKKQVLDLNKLWGGASGLLVDTEYINQRWEETRRTTAEIRIGYFAVLSQEDADFSTDKVNILSSFQNPLFNASWDTDDTSRFNEGDKECRSYNVWYRCYYLPMPTFDSQIWPNGVRENWAWLAQYVFDIKKETDMYRYGVDQRYAKSALVIWRDNTRPSHTDIKQRYMPQINFIWQRIQNCLVQDIEAMAFDQDLLSALLSAVDEKNQQQVGGGTQLVNQMKSLRQAGLAWLKFRDKNGQMVVQDPSKLFVKVQSGHLEKAERYMMLILSLYAQMTQALAAGDATTGVQPDPRTPAKGIEIAAQATQNARWFMEMPVIECMIMYGERCVQHVFNMLRETRLFNYKKRWEELSGVIGFANAMTLESVSDIPIENIGITVMSINNAQMQQIVQQMAMQKAAAKEIKTEDLSLIMDIENWKYALMEMAFAEDRAREEAMEMQQMQHQQTMEQLDMQRQIAMAMQGQKIDGNLQAIDLDGKIRQALQQQMLEGKFQTQAALKQQTNDLKTMQSANQAELDKQVEAFKKFLEQQSAL